MQTVAMAPVLDIAGRVQGLHIHGVIWHLKGGIVKPEYRVSARQWLNKHMSAATGPGSPDYGRDSKV
jgi:hypothetical protein